MFDGKAYGEGIVEMVKGYCEREIAPLKAENESLKARLKELEDRPAPEVLKGDPGESIDPETVQEMIAEAVSKAVAEIPVPRDGNDAAGIVEVLKDAGELVLTLSDGRLMRTGIRDGEKGEPGKDGFSLQDFNVQKEDDGRTLVLSFDAGDIRHEYELTMPHLAYCGVYKQDQEYMVGDVVTWGGSAWHCNEPTKEKPDDKAKDGPWSLMVKKGRDGKDARG